MNTKTEPRFTSKDLSQKLTDHIQELAAATDAARMSEAMLAYLEMSARFHQYSPNNVWLILMSSPNATLVAGFHKWREMGRYVKRGERGIPILAPVLVKTEDDDEQKELVGFTVVYVFDVSQTEGEPLPEPPEWKSLEQNLELQEKLTAFAQSKGITVTIKAQEGEIQGVSKGGAIEIDPQAGTKTLIHEIAHELMHREVDRIVLSPQVRELEAESVAFVVARHFGLNDLNSPNYVALHGADAVMILGHLERVRGIAMEIIERVEAL